MSKIPFAGGVHGAGGKGYGARGIGIMNLKHTQGAKASALLHQDIQSWQQNLPANQQCICHHHLLKKNKNLQYRLAKNIQKLGSMIIVCTKIKEIKINFLLT